MREPEGDTKIGDRSALLSFVTISHLEFQISNLRSRIAEFKRTFMAHSAVRRYLFPSPSSLFCLYGTTAVRNTVYVFAIDNPSNRAVPTRTMVAPSSMAISKSLLMPIDSSQPSLETHS